MSQASDSAMRFSLAIIHRNGAERLLQVLAAATRAADPARDELILVDNGSTDDSLERVRADFPQVVVIDNGCNKGFGRACNQAIARGRGEFVLLLNNDAFIEPDCLDRFEQVFRERPRAGLVTGQLFGPDGTPQRAHGLVPTPASEMGLARRKPGPLPADAVAEVETLVGACMAVRRQAIEAAGALDEDFFFYFEETEWCVRLRRHGWQVLVDPRIRVTHLKGASTRPLRRGAQVEMLRSRLLFYRKVFPAPVALGLAAWRIARLVLNAAVHGAGLVLTLGLVPRLHDKALTYLTQVAWLLLGQPERWGLPDKCPR